MKRKYKVLAISAATAVVLGALVITAGAVMNSYSNIIDMYLGQGDMHITKREGSEDWEGNYYDYETKNSTESWEYANKVNKQIAGEGIVLLKNENGLLPLAAGTKVSVLGRNAGHHVTAPTDDVSTIKGNILIGDALKTAGFDVNETAWNWYKSMKQVNDGSGEIAPTDADYQTNVASTYASYKNGVALIVLRRSYAEGADPVVDMGELENHRTALSPSENELALIEEACANFDNVVIAVSSPNAMELGFLKDGSAYHDKYTNKTYDFTKVRGAFWIGGLGVTGAESFAKIVKGEINPSGHLVDTYARDNIEDIPANRNYGKFEYTYTDPSVQSEFYWANNYDVEYEEGIYIGYRYFETAAYEAKNGNYAGFDYNKSVIYPFGYGLSYTTFEQEFKGAPKFNSANQSYTFEVEVKNTGSVAGKTPVQIYVSAPYTKGGIEKAHVVLAGFEKTKLLNPGESQVLEVEVQKDYFASYDYKVNKCYVLDAGDYKFFLSENAHSWDSIGDSDAKLCQKVHINEEIFKGDHKRHTDKVAAENLFDRDLNWKFKEYNETATGYATNFTRANFKDSYPTAPTAADLVANDYIVESFKKYDPDKDYSGTVSPYKDVEKVTEEQVVGVDRGILQLADMRGLDFDDPSWETFINQLNLEELTHTFTIGGWVDEAIEIVGAPALLGADSPSGITSFSVRGLNTFYPYCAEVLLTATWNTELAAAYGDALAEEAQAVRSNTGGQAMNYLFGPGGNTHRTPFGGRNQEYYSEDPYIAGKMLAAEASAAGEKGFMMLVKHCALNEQETVRQGTNDDNHSTTYTSFVNEQGLREIYMKVWEIYAKEAKKHVKYYNENGEFETVEMSAASAIMTSYNRIGGVWSGASPIVSGILRKECGFTGTSFTDAGGGKDSYMNTDYGLVTEGTTACLKSGGTTEFRDSSSNTFIYHLKNNAHFKLFNVANSNAMLGITPGSVISYSMAPWRVGLIVAYVATGVVILGLAGLTVFMFISPKGNVEKAKVAKEDEEE